MTTRHLDEAAIQAYLDGELPRESAVEAAAHVAGCAPCAEAVAAAEGEAAFFAAAFAPDESIGVPTETLRARVNAAVARLESAGGAQPAAEGGWSLNSLFAPLAGLFAFTPQRAAAFAGFAAVVAFAVIFALVQKQPATDPGAGGDRVARSETNPTPTPGAPPSVTAPASGEAGRVEVAVTDRPPDRVVVTTSAREPRRVPRRPAAPAKMAPAPEREVLLPGEKNYQEAVASLEKAVALGGDGVLGPKARFEYERNIALLDSAIAETRRAALRDPSDREAVGFLMAAYQSKVDLLTTVADRAQVAALGR